MVNKFGALRYLILNIFSFAFFSSVLIFLPESKYIEGVVGIAVLGSTTYFSFCGIREGRMAFKGTSILSGANVTQGLLIFLNSWIFCVIFLSFIAVFLFGE